MGKKQKEPDLAAQLAESYARWEYLRDYGGSDPLYDDATNMNLVRNHISYYKREMEKVYGNDMAKYPPDYFRELPPETERGYMARAAEIRDLAVEALSIYLSDPNFQFLLYHRDSLDKKELKDTCIGNVLGYASSLCDALKKDDLITMRRHAFRPESYQESFASCAQKVKDILEQKKIDMEINPAKQECLQENKQLSLFQFGLETAGQCR